MTSSLPVIDEKLEKVALNKEFTLGLNQKATLNEDVSVSFEDLGGNKVKLRAQVSTQFIEHIYGLGKISGGSTLNFQDYKFAIIDYGPSKRELSMIITRGD